MVDYTALTALAFRLTLYRQAQPPATTVTLQKGYHYIVVQHFPKSRRADAEEAALFLQDNGIPCALQTGSDIRLVVTEPFQIDQGNQAAVRTEQRRANALLEQIRKLGQQFNSLRLQNGLGGYTFSGCKLQSFK